MDRLHDTRNSVVALKCLIIIHHVIKSGPFILQDQLSIFPRNGGYNYLKLSGFRDGSTPATWQLSTWVRWYASYLETLLTASRVLGYFLCSCSNSTLKESHEHRISSFLNVDLIRDVDSLVVLMEETCKVPDQYSNTSSSSVFDDRGGGGGGDMILVKEITGLLANDYLSIVNEIMLRLGELNERLTCLTFGDSVELICDLKRLQDCRERLSTVMHMVKKPTVEMMWALVEQLRDKIANLKVYREGGRKLLCLRDKGCESDRFDQMRIGRDLVRFQSSRFDIYSG